MHTKNESHSILMFPGHRNFFQLILNRMMSYDWHNNQVCLCGHYATIESFITTVCSDRLLCA